MKMARSGFTLLEALIVWVIVGAVWCGLAALLALWTQCELEFWVSYVKGVPSTVPFWKAWVCSLLIPPCLAANIISEIVRLFV